jgi:hypothetical protein
VRGWLLALLAMRSIGYMYKRVVLRPDWMNASGVDDIYSISGCISQNFADYIKYWKHNGFWLFDSPAIIESLADDPSISLKGSKLFYYEAYEQEYDGKAWLPFEPEVSFGTHVLLPREKTLEGYDVATFAAHTSPECSPLSCNAVAAAVPTNRHCLFRSFEEAHSAVEADVFKDTEPGPYRIVAVYTVNDA